MIETELKQKNQIQDETTIQTLMDGDIYNYPNTKERNAIIVNHTNCKPKTSVCVCE